MGISTELKLVMSRKKYLESGRMLIPYGANKLGVEGYHLPFGGFTVDPKLALERMEAIYNEYGVSIEGDCGGS